VWQKSNSTFKNKCISAETEISQTVWDFCVMFLAHDERERGRAYHRARSTIPIYLTASFELVVWLPLESRPRVSSFGAARNSAMFC
jgi:hypothetical protein